MKNKDNKITILVLAILVILDVTITYFLNKEEKTFTFQHIKVFNQEVEIIPNKRVYQIKLQKENLTCNKDNSKYDKVFDVKVKDKEADGFEVVGEGAKQLFYYGYLGTSYSKKESTKYFDFLIEVDLEEALGVDEACQVKK